MNLRKISALALLAIAFGGILVCAPPLAPEIDPGSGMNALALVAGALLIVRSRKK